MSVENVLRGVVGTEVTALLREPRKDGRLTSVDLKVTYDLSGIRPVVSVIRSESEFFPVGGGVGLPVEALFSACYTGNGEAEMSDEQFLALNRLHYALRYEWRKAIDAVREERRVAEEQPFLAPPRRVDLNLDTFEGLV